MNPLLLHVVIVCNIISHYISNIIDLVMFRAIVCWEDHMVEGQAGGTAENSSLILFLTIMIAWTSERTASP